METFKKLELVRVFIFPTMLILSIFLGQIRMKLLAIILLTVANIILGIIIRTLKEKYIFENNRIKFYQYSTKKKEKANQG